MRKYFGFSLASVFLLSSFFCQVPVFAQGMNDGIKRFGAKDYDGAIKVFTDYVKANPQSADGYYYLAASYHRQNRNEDARKLYEYVNKNFPGSQAATYSQASIKSMSGSGAVAKTTATAKTREEEEEDNEIGPLIGPDEDRVPLHRGPGGHFMMTAYINGKSIEMMFDTGASSTVLSLDAWKSLGYKLPSGPPTDMTMGVGGLSGTWTVPATVGLGKFSRKMDVHLTEKMPGNGLIGQTFFSDLQYNLSSGNDYIHLFKKGAHSAGRSIPLNTINIPFRRSGNEMYVTVLVNGTPLEMIFDTGAAHNLIDTRAAAMLGIPIPQDVQMGMIGGVGGGKPAMILKVDSLKLGDLEKRNMEICIASVGVSLLGQPFFKDQHYVIDNDNKMIRFFH